MKLIAIAALALSTLVAGCASTGGTYYQPHYRHTCVSWVYHYGRYGHLYRHCAWWNNS